MAATADEAPFRAFFDEFVALGHAFDPALIDRYADDAEIQSLRRSADGQEQTLRLDGRQWKELVLASLDLARQRDDRSEYSDVTVLVSEDGERATVRATRYSTAKCVTDPSYYVVIERRNGALFVVEEYSESTFESQCDTQAETMDVEQLVAVAVQAANSQFELPIQVDEETRLDAIRAAGKNIEYHFVLFNFAADELDPTALVANLRPLLLAQTCERPSLAPILDLGGGMLYRYYGKDDVEVASVRMGGEDCGPAAVDP